MPKPVAWRAGADERRKFRKNNFLAEASEDGGSPVRNVSSRGRE